MEEFEMEVSVNESSELHRVAVNMVPMLLCDPKVLPISPPHVDMTVQLMAVPPLLMHWYEATSPEHTGPGPTSSVD